MRGEIGKYPTRSIPQNKIFTIASDTYVTQSGICVSTMVFPNALPWRFAFCRSFVSRWALLLGAWIGAAITHGPRGNIDKSLGKILNTAF